MVVFIQQIHANPQEKYVQFAPVHTWQVGEENTIEYYLPLGFDEHESDWIGIFKVNQTTGPRTL